jgi:sulfonate transport system substrate-binding protein
MVLAVSVAACGEKAAPSGSLTDPLANSVPANTVLNIADQNELAESTFAASGEQDKLSFKTEYANLNGQPQVLEALRNGSDIAFASEVGAVYARAQGVPVRVVSVLGNDKNSYKFFTSHGDITSVAQLKGKKIAYVDGTSYGLYTLRVLKSAGLSLKDVELVKLDFTTLPDAIRTGQVDAGALTQPTATTFPVKYAATGFHQLSEGDDLSTGLANTMYATEAALKDPAKAAAIREYVTAWVHASQWRNQNPGGWEKYYYVDKLGLPADTAKLVNGTTGMLTFPTLSSLIPIYQGYIDALVDAGELPKSLNASDVFDLRFDDVQQSAARAE